MNKNILLRLGRLERVVFGEQDKKNFKKQSFKGPKGGVLFLISKGFFKTKKDATKTKLELEKHDYYYKREVVQTALNRLASSKGLLVALKEGDKKTYVERK